MTEIRVTYPRNLVNERTVGSRLFMVFLGAKRRVLLPLSVAMPFIIGATLLHQFTSVNMLRNEVMFAIFLFYLGIATWMFTVNRLTRLADAQVNRAPCRQGDTTLVFDTGGFQIDGVAVPWDWVTDVTHFRKQTIIVLSLRRAVVVPDSALPDGLTPDTFRQQLESWRA